MRILSTTRDVVKEQSVIDLCRNFYLLQTFPNRLLLEDIDHIAGLRKTDFAVSCVVGKEPEMIAASVVWPGKSVNT